MYHVIMLTENYGLHFVPIDSICCTLLTLLITYIHLTIKT